MLNELVHNYNNPYEQLNKIFTEIKSNYEQI